MVVFKIIKGGATIKIIVAGGRDFTNYAVLKKELDYLFQNVVKEDLTIISGTAKGADTLAIKYANEKNISLIQMPADWSTYRKSAGFKRNVAMAQIADGLVAFWDGKSHGTGHMIKIAEAKGLKVRIINY